MTNWLIRVGDGQNFINSSKYNTWGCTTRTFSSEAFVNNVRKGDKLWFIKANSNGKVLAVATYSSHNKRELGPLINTTLTDEELGWEETKYTYGWDTEIHYIQLYNVSKCELFTHIKGACPIRKENEKCLLDLDIEYFYITKYANITTTF